MGNGYNGRSGRGRERSLFGCVISSKIFKVPEPVSHLQNGDSNSKPSQRAVGKTEEGNKYKAFSTVSSFL